MDVSNLRRHLKPGGTRPVIMYDSCRLHKKYVDDCPSFRPILSALKTPIHKRGKFLVAILEQLTNSKRTSQRLV